VLTVRTKRRGTTNLEHAAVVLLCTVINLMCSSGAVGGYGILEPLHSLGELVRTCTDSVGIVRD
jgi:hypothetical protein